MSILKQAWKSYKLAKSKYYLKGVDVVMIASSGRTGTQFFETLYKRVDKNNMVLHEPKPDLFDLSTHKIRQNWSEEQVKNYIAIHRATLLEKQYGIFRRLIGKRITYIESNPFVYSLLKEYKSLVRSFKVIYISRDPKTYIISANNKDPRSDGKNNFYGDTDKRKRITAVDFNEMDAISWSNLDRIERIAWYWNKSNEILNTYVEVSSSDSIWITFESLFSKDEQVKFDTLKKILYFSEVEPTSDDKIKELLKLFATKVNESKLLSGASKFDDLDAKTQKNIKGRVAPMAQKLSYL